MTRPGTTAHRCFICVGLPAVIAATLKLAAVASAAGIIWIHLCGSWTPGSGGTWGSLGVARSGSSTAGITTPYQCPQGSSAWGMEAFGGGTGVRNGGVGFWEIDAPPGLSIVEAHTEGSGMVSYGINANMGWRGGFYWQGGSVGTRPGQVAYGSPPINSPYFGWHIICGWSTCNGTTKPGEISILGLEIEAAETSGPLVLPAPGSLAVAHGWVRGWWPVAFYADGPSGACQLAATLGGVSVSQPVNEPRGSTTWHQCPTGSFSQTFNTASVASEPRVPLFMWARDAAYDYGTGAYLSRSVTTYVNVDNEPVSVSLSGPTDAASTAGVQYISVNAAAGPSGVQGISCTLDGAPEWYAGASARVPVSGIGQHAVRCAADDNAVDPAGNHGWSNWAAWTLNIRQPTVSVIGFSKLVDAMLCHQTRERVTAPARWMTVRRRHRLVRVRRPGRTKLVRVTRCHPRIVHHKIAVWLTVRRHGRDRRVRHEKTIRVVELPHVIMKTIRRVGHGRPAAVSGWLGTPAGTPLAGQLVHVLTAPDNGLGQFGQAAVATTTAKGGWSAKLPPGPSRLVEAVYGGTATFEPSTSEQVRVVVPADVRLIRVWPTRVPWSTPGHAGTVRITGQLEGGYLPPDGALVRLRIGSGSRYTTYGVQEHVTGHGRFTTTYTFGFGLPDVHRAFWFQIASLPMGDYPWAPAASRRITVIVGGT